MHAPGSDGVFVHEVEAHERNGFTATHTTRALERPAQGPVGSQGDISEELHWGVAGVTGKTREAMAVCEAVAPATRGVFLTEGEGGLSVVASPPDAHPQAHGPRRLFTLEPGQRGRWRYNARFTPSGCSCHAHHWWYEKWVVNVAYLTGTPAVDLFTRRAPTHVVDDLVRLL